MADILACSGYANDVDHVHGAVPDAGDVGLVPVVATSIG
jgi:hypothetical protein